MILKKICKICKNSWGDTQTATPSFNFSQHTTHDYRFIRVHFTLDRIKSKTTKKYKAKLKPFKGTLNRKLIDCAWMNEKTTVYSSDYVWEYHPNQKSPLKYLGYDVNQWIIINLNHH